MTTKVLCNIVPIDTLTRSEGFMYYGQSGWTLMEASAIPSNCTHFVVSETFTLHDDGGGDVVGKYGDKNLSWTQHTYWCSDKSCDHQELPTRHHFVKTTKNGSFCTLRGFVATTRSTSFGQ